MLWVIIPSIWIMVWLREEMRDFISPRDDDFVNRVNTNFKDDECVNTLYDYIYATADGEGENRLTTRAKIVTDGQLGILEIPHLAVVIKCYIRSLALNIIYWSKITGITS